MITQKVYNRLRIIIAKIATIKVVTKLMRISDVGNKKYNFLYWRVIFIANNRHNMPNFHNNEKRNLQLPCAAFPGFVKPSSKKKDD